MASEPSPSALERLLRPLSRELTLDLARALINVQADAETQARYDAEMGRAQGSTNERVLSRANQGQTAAPGRAR